MSGAITKSKTSVVQKKLDESESEILSYLLAENIHEFFKGVKEIIIPFDLSFDYPINFFTPKKGDKKTLLLLSKKNALAKKIEFLKTELVKNPVAANNKVLEIIQKDLRLKKLPVLMECFDNSNTQGNFPVAACVVFKNGKPLKKNTDILILRLLKAQMILLLWKK